MAGQHEPHHLLLRDGRHQPGRQIPLRRRAGPRHQETHEGRPQVQGREEAEGQGSRRYRIRFVCVVDNRFIGKNQSFDLFSLFVL